MASPGDGRWRLFLPALLINEGHYVVRKSPHLVLGVELTGWLKLITVRKLQEAMSPESTHHWKGEKLSFKSTFQSTAATTSAKRQTNMAALISWTFIIQKYSTNKNTHIKGGFHTVCKPQRRSSYNISMLTSKLQLILLVEVELCIPICFCFLFFLNQVSF